jgi:hypothetical protein
MSWFFTTVSVGADRLGQVFDFLRGTLSVRPVRVMARFPLRTRLSVQDRRNAYARTRAKTGPVDPK